MSSPTSTRYITSSSLPYPSPPTYSHHLSSSLHYILSTCPPTPPTPPSFHSFSGLYSGPTSLAYLFLRLSQLYPTLAVNGKSCREWAAEYLSLEPPLQRGSQGRISIRNCGIASELLARAAVGAALDQDRTRAGEVAMLEVLLNDRYIQGGSNEWICGRAGYLYLLRMLRESYPGEGQGRDSIDTAMRNTISRIMDDWRDSPSGEGWMWHGKNYLGAAHGIAGIITQIVLSCNTTNTPPPPDLSIILNALLNQQLPSGNWPHSNESDSKDTLVQFCHGAPGIIVSLLSIRDSFPDLREKIDAAIATGREVVESRGLLTKSPCLCHGISGNALAFGDAETVDRWLGYTTREFMERNKEGGLVKQWEEGEEGDKRCGLWTGEGGRAWGFVVGEKLAEGEGKWAGRVIGYNDL